MPCRHTFATRTLLDWFRQGLDVDAEMYKLSTVLGHSCPGGTYWYIEAVPELLALEDVQDFIKEKEEENAEEHDGESKLVTLVMIQRTSPYEQMVNVMDELQLGAIDRFSITVLEQDKYEEVFGS